MPVIVGNSTQETMQFVDSVGPVPDAASYQAALADACAFANTNMMAKYDMKNPAAIKQLVAEGAILRPFSQEILEACFNAAQEVYAEISGSNEWFKKIYEDQVAFKKEGYLWMQLSEYTYDTFMMIQQRNGKLAPAAPVSQ